MTPHELDSMTGRATAPDQETMTTVPRTTTSPPSATPPSGPRPGAGFSLTDLLNILWRKRFLIVGLTLLGGIAGGVYGVVVTPLHIASTTVQPGITTYGRENLPIREWEIKDIVHWYKRGDYNPGVAYLLEVDPTTFWPIIRASYLPRGPQSRGGNTITLTTLMPEPERAKTILDAAVQVFNDFAAADTVHSSIHLTWAGLQGQMKAQRAKLDQMQAKRMRVELQIGAAIQDQQHATASVKITEAQIRQRETARELAAATLEVFASMMIAMREDVTDLEAKLTEWEATARDLQDRQESLSSASDAMSIAMITSSTSTLIQELGNLRLGVFSQSDRLLSWENTSRQLKSDVGSLEEEIAELKFDLEQTIPRLVFDAEQQIAELELQRDYDLAEQETEIEQTLRGMEIRQRTLLPLQQVGSSVASAKPVRPRKMRAFLILLGLGFVSSIFGAFALEYLGHHWKEITRPAT